MEGHMDENFLVEGLREMLLALEALVQKLEQMLPPQTRPPAGTSPQDHDWVFRLLSVLVVVASLAVLLYYVFFRGSEWVGGWGATRMLMKPPGGGGPSKLYEHEGIVAAIATLLFIVVSLGSLYYYYCYQAGCFGDGGHAAMMMDVPGRKLQLTSR